LQAVLGVIGLLGNNMPCVGLSGTILARYFSSKGVLSANLLHITTSINISPVMAAHFRFLTPQTFCLCAAPANCSPCLPSPIIARARAPWRSTPRPLKEFSCHPLTLRSPWDYFFFAANPGLFQAVFERGVLRRALARFSILPYLRPRIRLYHTADFNCRFRSIPRSTRIAMLWIL